MKILKISVATLILAASFSSCQKEEIILAKPEQISEVKTINSNESFDNNSDSQNEYQVIFDDVLKQIQEIDHKKINAKSSELSINLELLHCFENKNNVELNLDNKIEQLLINSVEDNFDVALKNNFSEEQINGIKLFYSDVVNHDFFYAIEKLENNFQNNNRIMLFATSMRILNEVNPNYFINDNQTLSNCFYSAIGFDISCLGLAVLEVGSGGLATGVAVAGFIYASADLGRNC